MPAKSVFSEPQLRILRETATRLRKKFRNQEDMALALGIAQPSLSSLLKGKWKPGITTAKAIAHLDQLTLEELIGAYGDVSPQPAGGVASETPYPNLEVCIRFHSGTKSWSAWTLAAARAGFWGGVDLPPPAWPEKLDALERGLEKLRKT